MYAISLFKNKHDNYPQPARRTWEQICANLARPSVRASKDGLLFSPATFDPSERKKANVKEISMLVLDYDYDSSLDSDLKVWEALGVRFGVYTTHSHRRATDSNPNADDRFRMLIPLAEPVPADLFAGLWEWAASTSNGKIDGQAKDESRMFYTPVKATHDAPYEYRIVDGAALDWRTLSLESVRHANGRRGDAGANGSGYANWHALKAELGRRIMARGQRNGSGKWDAQARCHKGAGHSGVFYNPATNQTTCNKGCSEAAILRAEDLPVQPDRQTEGESWSVPTPFHEYNLPAFPVESLPDWLRQYVEAEAWFLRRV